MRWGGRWCVGERYQSLSIISSLKEEEGINNIKIRPERREEKGRGGVRYLRQTLFLFLGFFSIANTLAWRFLGVCIKEIGRERVQQGSSIYL